MGLGTNCGLSPLSRSRPQIALHNVCIYLSLGRSINPLPLDNTPIPSDLVALYANLVLLLSLLA